MKFAKYMKKHSYPLFKDNNLKYSKLKRMLPFEKNNHMVVEFDSEKEQEFKKLFEDELDRVVNFIEEKKKYYEIKLDKIEKVVKKIKKKDNKKTKKEKDKKNRNHIQKKVIFLQTEIRNLSEFVKINTVGFKNLLKKHDKYTKYKLMHIFKKQLKERIKSINLLDKLLYKISKIMLINTEDKLKKNKLSNVEFIRKTNKYWVHRDNIASLKCIIVKHLPIYVYENKKEDESIPFINRNATSPYSAWNPSTHDTCISSVYFDNKSFDIYSTRLHKLHESECIRIRWYGMSITDTVFVERKKHEDGWTGEDSKKLRFIIRERDVLPYVNGVDVWSEVKPLNMSNLKDARRLYTEIQESIIKKKLRPSVRTFYRRSAFQRPDSAEVRISLDTDLCMIKECFDWNEKEIKTWRRMDVGCEYPFRNLKRDEIVRFPHAIMEIKTQFQDYYMPGWIEELISGPLVEHVHKFSKFMHGTAMLYQHIEEIPYWLPQLRTDIRKDPYYTPRAHTRDFRDGMLIEIPRTPKHTESTPLLTDESVSGVLEMNLDDKRIAVPIRIEPKVFFANERTFLSWLNFSIFVGGIGTAMLGLGDRKAMATGVAFICVSLMFALYALYLYFWRAHKIRSRDAGPYDDLVGPAVLVCVFCAVMLVSILFKFPLKRF
ncbi:Vacuolar transporter chaperone 4 [Astathelohania contejeani]|uniref:Vacuolar transporter chaperone 4 n=1 Tax=Astathelohania contejeani TaxID=164912 RepID=A0ABQ7I0Z2_9MICR|nr:Vacuolar transporter chaperone 4 [Thelohania contejeani]